MYIDRKYTYLLEPDVGTLESHIPLLSSFITKIKKKQLFLLFSLFAGNLLANENIFILSSVS
jgi:hypothetical protein